MPEEAAGKGAGPESIFVISTRKHTLFEGGRGHDSADDDDDYKLC